MGDFGSITVANDRMGMGRITGLEPWASDAKWDGTPSKRKSYIEKIETKLMRFPEMMAMWNSALSDGYSKDNFAAAEEAAKATPSCVGIPARGVAILSVFGRRRIRAKT